MIKTAIPQAHAPYHHPIMGSPTTTPQTAPSSTLPPYKRGPAPRPPAAALPSSATDNDIYNLNMPLDDPEPVAVVPKSRTPPADTTRSVAGTSAPTMAPSLGDKGTVNVSTSPPPQSTVIINAPFNGKDGNKDQKRKKITIKRFFRTKNEDIDDFDFLNISGPTNFRKNDIHQEGNSIVSEDGKTLSTLPDQAATSPVTSAITSSQSDVINSSNSNNNVISNSSSSSSTSGGGGFMGLGKRRIDPSKRPRVPGPAEYRSNIDRLVQKMREMAEFDWNHPLLVDYWSSRPLPLGEWCETPPPERSLAGGPAVRERGYHIEVSARSTTGKVLISNNNNSNSITNNGENENLINNNINNGSFGSFGSSGGDGCVCGGGGGEGDGSVDGEDDGMVVLYGDRDYRYFEEFFCGKGSETYVVDDEENPCVVSVAKSTELFKVIIRTKKDDKRVLVPADNYFKALKVVAPELK